MKPMALASVFYVLQNTYDAKVLHIEPLIQSCIFWGAKKTTEMTVKQKARSLSPRNMYLLESMLCIYGHYSIVFQNF